MQRVRALYIFSTYRVVPTQQAVNELWRIGDELFALLAWTQDDDFWLPTHYRLSLGIPMRFELHFIDPYKYPHPTSGSTQSLENKNRRHVDLKIHTKWNFFLQKLEFRK